LALAAVIFFTYLGYSGLNFSALAMIGFVLSAVFWLVAAPLWLVKLWRPSGASSAWYAAFTGWVVVFPTWLAFLSLHDRGAWTLLTFAILVWVADIGAYFVGKTFGRNKLAPSISPGKTVEGALGGIAGVAIYFFVWQHFSSHAALRGDEWARELQSHGYVLFGIFLLLGVMSVIGDLFESWMKRGVGMKDSSSLLPGHGGVLDRIDALTSTLPFAGLYLIVMQKL
jgi:phosphatidate cytidylyltransferase